MADVNINAKVRTQFGKGFARRARVQKLTPAVIYYKGEKPDHVLLDTHEIELALKQLNALFEIDVEGIKKLAVVKDIQKHPVRRTLVHIDFIEVRAGEKVKVEIPIHLVGETQPHVLHLVENDRVEVLSDPLSIPESIELSIEGQEAGSSLHVRDLSIPSNLDLISDPDFTLVTFQQETEEKASDTQVDESASASGESSPPEPGEESNSE
ncbi:MAG: 50S ribosomal protein L25/general stress protein Ctc [Bifidobacteriaceae bacterium]|jgi:large subunit ribosomal protein L25|nr:50S ribosomal protein L25/general stress protein Ctc [Bifidobacteriaceae bacterium]